MNLKSFFQKIFFTCLLFISSNTFLFSINTDSLSPKIIRKDTSALVARSFNQDKLNAFADDNDFNYKDEFENPENFWSEFLWWLNKQMNLYKAIGYTWEYGKYVLIAVAILLIVLQLLKVPILGFFSRKSIPNAIPFQVTEENIQQMDFDVLIAEALQKKLYRNAVRYLYLKTLKQLSNHNYIQWQQDKTNTDYTNEIIHQELKLEFENITLVFEKIWYGEFPATHKVVDELIPICNKVETIIQNKF